ncbi:MAG: M20/M25/M40 family metallo-hydrolase [Thaumarchaeota archaeon]|nr:M20/M25/M40 family metallo-hydrolase [Nitrososphaerota archaeon]
MAAKMGKQISPPPDSVQKAWKYAAAHKADFVNSLKNLVSQPSVSAQNIGLKECAEMVREQMAELGFTVKLLKVERAPDIVYGTMQSVQPSAKTLVIYNHYDVQPAEPLDEWKSDPYKPVERSGKLYGRGVGDDKGELVARFNAIESLLNSGERPRSHLKWMVEGEEEVGSPHLHGFVEKNKPLLKGEGCLWEGGERTPSGRSEIHLGVKGLLYAEYHLKVGKKDQHSQYGAIAPNPAWRLVNLLKTLRNEKGKILIEGFYDDVIPPTLKERQLIRANEFSAKELQKALEIDYLLEEKDDIETVTKHLFSPTANIAGFGSGYQGKGAKTIVPKEAFAKMDFRLVAEMKAADILAKLKRHIREKEFTDVELEVYGGEDPAKTSVESHIAQTMIRCSEMAEGEPPNVWPTIAGTGPMNLFTNLVGVPTAMGLGVNYAGASFHAPNEHIVLDYYHRGIRQLICLFAIF